VAAGSADPSELTVGSLDDAILLDLFHDGLTRIDSDGAVIGALADTWAVDGDTWSFTLADNASFADGTSVEPGDVVASLTAMAASGSLAGQRLDMIEGVAELLSGDADTISGLSVEDRRVVIEVVRPAASLPRLLAAPWYGVLPAGVGPDFFDAPQGSGPYRVTEEADTSMSLEPVRPGSDALEVLLADDRAAAAALVSDGSADWALVGDEEATGSGITQGSVDSGAIRLMMMNPSHPALADVDVRRTVRHLLDVDALEAAGLVERRTGILGGEISCTTVCDGDEARAEVVLAGAEATEPIPIDVIDVPELSALAVAIAEQLEAGGLEVDVRFHEVDAYRELLLSGDVGIHIHGSIGLVGAPSEYLIFPFAGVSAERTILDPDEDLDELLAEVERTEGTDRDAAIDAALEGLAEEAVVVSLGPITVGSARNESIGAIEVGPGGLVDLSTTQIIN